MASEDQGSSQTHSVQGFYALDGTLQRKSTNFCAEHREFLQKNASSALQGRVEATMVRPLAGLLGRRQAVRQWILIPPCGGSNPPAPATAFH